MQGKHNNILWRKRETKIEEANSMTFTSYDFREADYK